MKPCQVRASLTDEDWATVGVIFRDLDRNDADLMYALADLKKQMPDGKAVAHRMLEGRFGVPDSILIDGWWVALG